MGINSIKAQNKVVMRPPEQENRVGFEADKAEKGRQIRVPAAGSEKNAR